MRTEPEDVATVMTSPSRLWTVPRIVCGVAGAVGGEEVVDGVGGDDLWLQAWRENAAASNAETMAHRRCLLYLFTSLNSDFAFQVGMESSFMRALSGASALPTQSRFRVHARDIARAWPPIYWTMVPVDTLVSVPADRDRRRHSHEVC